MSALIFEPIDCQVCGETIPAAEWTDHVRTHNPSAYREGWPCRCRPDKPCHKHIDAPWFKEPS